MKKILVLNAGSSTLKYQLFNVDGENYDVIAKGNAERIGRDASFVGIKYADGIDPSQPAAYIYHAYFHTMFSLPKWVAPDIKGTARILYAQSIPFSASDWLPRA